MHSVFPSPMTLHADPDVGRNLLALYTGQPKEYS